MDDPRIDPADLRSVRFPTARRGYDPRAVDTFIESIAARMESINRLLADLEFGAGKPGGSSAITVLPAEETEVEAAPEIEAPEPVPAPAPVVETPKLATLSDDELATLVGEETAHVLATARKAATDIRTKAEEAAARLIREATAEASRLTEDARTEASALRDEAQSARDDAVRAAEEAAAQIRTDAEAAAAQLRAEAERAAEQAEARADEIRAEAEAEAARAIEDARDEGRSMVAEAKEVRARVLTDLQRRRDLGRSQVERLVAGRDRLLDAYAAVRANVDEITAQLDTALVDAADVAPGLDDEIAAAVADAEAAAAEVTAATTAEPAPEAADASAPEEPDATEPDAAEPDTTEPDATEQTVAGDDSADVDDADEDPDDGPDEAVTPESSDDPTGGEGGDVDALFARIRAERAESVARAQQILEGSDEVDVPAADGAAEVAEDERGSEAAEESDGDDEADADADDVGAESPDEVPIDMAAMGPVHERRSETIAELEKNLSRALKRHLADEQNVVLDALRQTEQTDADALLPDEAAHAEGYAQVARESMAAAARVGAEAMGGDIDGAAVVTDLATELGTTLTEAFRRRVERSASEVDGDADALDDRLRALYREWKTERIGPAASHALLAAFAAGQFEAAPAKSRLRWLIDPTTKSCPDCHDNALAGAVDKGEAFPTGDLRPPAHPGCDCLLAVE